MQAPSHFANADGTAIARRNANPAYYIGRAEFDLDTSTPIIYNKYK